MDLPSIPKPPPPPPEPRLITFDGKGGKGRFANEIYEWLWNVAEGKCEKDSEIVRLGKNILILLKSPMEAASIQGGFRYIFNAAILRVQKDESVDGWLIEDHAKARETWNILNEPEEK